MTMDYIILFVPEIIATSSRSFKVQRDSSWTKYIEDLKARSNLSSDVNKDLGYAVVGIISPPFSLAVS